MSPSSETQETWVDRYKDSGELPRASVFTNLNHFERLQLPCDFKLDEALLEKNYLKFSALLHPDRHVSKGPREQMKAVALSAALNESARVLRSDVERAELVFVQAGGASADADKSLPNGFLLEMLEVREELEDAVKAEDNDALQRIYDQTNSQRQQLIGWLTTALADLKPESFPQVRVRLNTFRYLDNVLNQCREQGIRG